MSVTGIVCDQKMFSPTVHGELLSEALKLNFFSKDPGEKIKMGFMFKRPSTKQQNVNKTFPQIHVDLVDSGGVVVVAQQTRINAGS